MGPAPARATLVAKLHRVIKEEFPELPDNKSMAKRLEHTADRAVDICLPNLHPRSCAGKPIIEMMWDELMAVYERLAEGAEAKDGRDPGRAEGMALCIAILQNPYQPNIEAVREESVRRYEEEYADED